MAKVKRAYWKVTAEWIGEEIKGVVKKGDIDTHEFRTIERWADDKEKSKKAWQKVNPSYKLIDIELKGISKVEY